MPLNTLSQIFNTTAIKAVPNQNNNLLDFVGTSGTTVASVTAGGVLDLRATSGTVLGDGSSVIGNKIQLWANTFGIGIQSGRLVIYNDSGSATSIRTSLTGSDIIRFNNDGNLSTRFVDSLANSGAYLDMGVGTAGIITVNRNASHVPLTIRGAISQGSDLQQWQNSAGSALSVISSTGRLGIGAIDLVGVYDTMAWIQTSSASTIGLVVSSQSGFSQTADLQRWVNFNNGNYARVTASADVVFGDAANSPLGHINAFSRTATSIPLVVQGWTLGSQTADLTQWRPSIGIMSKIRADGGLEINGKDIEIMNIMQAY
jgi:hypothetical protein